MIRRASLLLRDTSHDPDLVVELATVSENWDALDASVRAYDDACAAVRATWRRIAGGTFTAVLFLLVCAMMASMAYAIVMAQTAGVYLP